MRIWPQIDSFLAAIAWKKKAFHKYFESPANWIQFYKYTHRLLEAPTLGVTELIQDEIVEWLREITGRLRRGLRHTGQESLATTQMQPLGM